MNQNWFLRIGIRAVAAVLILLSLSATTLTQANEEPPDNRYVPVVYDGLVRYLLDTTTLKRHIGLSGQSLVDVWVEGRLAAGAGSRMQAFLEGYPPGVDYAQVGTVRVRYLFRIDGPIPHRESLTAVIERQYFDLNGRVIRQEPFNPPANPSEWRSLNEVEEKALQVIIQQSAFQAAQRLDNELRNSAVAKDLDEGFLGRPWGICPFGFKGARHIADIAPKVMVFSADLDLSPILGLASDYSAPRLVFTEDGGLVKARIAFNPRDYDLAHKYLVRVLGEPAPIMYELWAARIDFDERSEWLVGRTQKWS